MLCSLGYQNTKISLVNAAACGVPQNRQRVIIHGSLEGESPNFDDLKNPIDSGPTVDDALADLPDPSESLAVYRPGVAVPYSTADKSSYAAQLRGRKRLVTRWEPVTHADTIIRGFSFVEQGKIEPRSKCFRLQASGLSRTLRAGTRSRTACRPIHPDQNRVITVREAARLHSFPDWFQFPDTTSGAHVAIGNSVPPLMARVIAEKLLAPGVISKQ
jgi:DNA (cytosine-5)-methyltransferase 1